MLAVVPLYVHVSVVALQPFQTWRSRTYNLSTRNIFGPSRERLNNEVGALKQQRISYEGVQQAEQAMFQASLARQQVRYALVRAGGGQLGKRMRYIYMLRAHVPLSSPRGKCTCHNICARVHVIGECFKRLPGSVLDIFCVYQVLYCSPLKHFWNIVKYVVPHLCTCPNTCHARPFITFPALSSAASSLCKLQWVGWNWKFWQASAGKKNCMPLSKPCGSILLLQSWRYGDSR